LAITKAIVDAHGGTIGVDSGPGEGTRVWFTLPTPTEHPD
jgi:signal transduction histidine kinase